MKRHESLVALSREHHNCLVIAQRLILGRATNPKSFWPQERGLQRDRLLDFFYTNLDRHFIFEETHVFPSVVEQLVNGEAWSRSLTADHETMRAMIRDFETSAHLHVGKRLNEFGVLLRAHVRKEERELFEQIQDTFPPERLISLGVDVALYATETPECHF